LINYLKRADYVMTRATIHTEIESEEKKFKLT
jgi:hypothetical protein